MAQAFSILEQRTSFGGLRVGKTRDLFSYHLEKANPTTGMQAQVQAQVQEFGAIEIKSWHLKHSLQLSDLPEPHHYTFRHKHA